MSAPLPWIEYHQANKCYITHNWKLVNCILKLYWVSGLEEWESVSSSSTALLERLHSTALIGTGLAVLRLTGTPRQCVHVFTDSQRPGYVVGSPQGSSWHSRMSSYINPIIKLYCCSQSAQLSVQAEISYIGLMPLIDLIWSSAWHFCDIHGLIYVDLWFEWRAVRLFGLLLLCDLHVHKATVSCV